MQQDLTYLGNLSGIVNSTCLESGIAKSICLESTKYLSQEWILINIVNFKSQ